MKRTAEKILSWTGVAIHVVGLLLATITLFGMRMDFNTPNSTIDATTMNLYYVIYIFTILILIIAIIASILITKKSKLSGILLIVSGVLVLIPNFISAILWIISGVMMLIKKPKPSLYNNLNNQKELKDHTYEAHDPYERNKFSKESSDEDKEEVEDPFKY
ncbi:DUF4064 domain-containing protein [Staphylococcus haemolyticus]|uniref:DUF4064 domain-containing protein n=1 Tax=Staphylococcus haemolyticus TaxID=1283 RepID=UPI00187AB06E|nr:DUF4064 domain-containing protein [Staphylococcus haemolyticus]MBE7355487.1 DUF4064 domain-containing protein [Staphylococcus haemolyticus]MDT0705608.1 DUF4064 domain-containing protein [Staphylococcus haemolyticus]MDT0738564.1 DUF4064 domain-containing protein [Staphylococcus haemolyticus]